jgi:hypothetical protein
MMSYREIIIDGETYVRSINEHLTACMKAPIELEDKDEYGHSLHFL